MAFCIGFYAYAIIVHTRADQLLPQLLMEQFDTLSIQYTVKLWSLELACLEHRGSLELVRWSLQFSYTFNVKMYPRLEQRWLELSNSKRGPQGDFSCKNTMMARTKYFFT